ncbi:TrkA C-terminal domain-containing protein [Paenibacillus rigui]|nr:hypothetical protein [Paenibacillus rigui]
MLFILIYLLFIMIVVEISSVLLILSGLNEEIARFQAISMLTATGFTTKESELISRHPIRRNIAMFLILFGVFSLAVLISSISSLIEQNFRLPHVSLMAIGMILILTVMKNKMVMRLLRSKFQHHLRKEFELHELPVEEVLYTCENDMLKAISIGAQSKTVNQPLQSIFDPEEDMIVLFVQRGIEKIRHQCLKLIVQEGDVLFVYGSKSAIEAKFSFELDKMKEDMQSEEHAVEL